ncbi:hypothetical protein [Paraflavitalea speifideaquila]|nr:hypothetical protein [Paraflavitalea speifideiaquila]
MSRVDPDIHPFVFRYISSYNTFLIQETEGEIKSRTLITTTKA